MSAAAPEEFLKAHAIVSRSWLLAALNRKREPERTSTPAGIAIENNEEVLHWYDRESHDLFDVCADDHCQRYQGITRIAAGRAAEAVRATRGVFLIRDGEI